MPSLNKICSAKQEKTVADFMGWKVVSGSGSQQFAPGDINSYRFLLECKTHTDVQDTIVFYKKAKRLASGPHLPDIIIYGFFTTVYRVSEEDQTMLLPLPYVHHG